MVVRVPVPAFKVRTTLPALSTVTPSMAPTEVETADVPRAGVVVNGATPSPANLYAVPTVTAVVAPSTVRFPLAFGSTHVHVPLELETYRLPAVSEYRRGPMMASPPVTAAVCAPEWHVVVPPPASWVLCPAAAVTPYGVWLDVVKFR